MDSDVRASTRAGAGGVSVSHEREIWVLHRVHNQLVVTRCRSFRDSNVVGFVELVDVVSTSLEGLLKDQYPAKGVEVLVVPKTMVVAVLYPREKEEKVVYLVSAEEEEDSS